MVDKYYFIKGGAERYFFELKNVLESNGHEVIPFSMQHPNNFKTPYESDFVSNIEFNGLSKVQKLKQVRKIFGRIVYSYEAKNAIAKIIDKVKPDVAHLHMIDHQLSPSILHALRDYNIPIIQTCHQYKLVCPSYRLFVMHKNQICEKCVGGDFYHAVVEKCHKESRAASSLLAFESYIHKWMKIYDLIDLFHVPSQFLGDKLIEGGIPQRKIWHQFYTINLDDYPYHPTASDYCIYYGRLSEEKGVKNLLKAMVNTPDVNLYIMGDGPYRLFLEDFAKSNRLENVKFWGNQSGEKLVNLVQNSKFVIVPSEWYDNSPLVIYESFSMGKPVIVSALGGMPELVDHGINGLHFTAGNVDELTDRIKQLWLNAEYCNHLGSNARAKAEKEFSAEVHYKRIIDIYEKLINSKNDNQFATQLHPSEIVENGSTTD